MSSKPISVNAPKDALQQQQQQQQPPPPARTPRGISGTSSKGSYRSSNAATAPAVPTLSGVVRHSGITPDPTPRTQSPSFGPASSSTTSAVNSSVLPLSGASFTANAAPAAAAAASETARIGDEVHDGGDGAAAERGWVPVQDGRFRVALMRHYEERDEPDMGISPHNTYSAFTSAVPEELNSDAAAAALCEEALRSPTHDPYCNTCEPAAPRIELQTDAFLVNAINSAYTSTGYPFVVTTGNTRGAVYGSFVDTSNPSLSSIELPPPQSVIVAPSYTGGQTPAHGLTEMDTLLAIRWNRGDRMMTTAGTAAAAAVAASQSKSGGGAAGSFAGRDGKALNSSSAPRPTSAGPAGAPHSVAVARTIAHHLLQYPEGVHGIHSSMDLRRLLVDGKLPRMKAPAPSAPTNAAYYAPAAVAGGNVGAPAAAASTGHEEGGATGGAATATSTAVPSSAEANVPPLPRPPVSNAPVQHTLVSASTFNHLSVYFVAHQDGHLLYTAPIQTLSASIATRKVTAHQLILVGREEVQADARDPLKAVTSKPNRRTKIAFSEVPITGDEGAVFFESRTSHFLDADPRKKTIAAASIRFTVEPHLLFGNQNGDIFIFSLLQERIVQHINYNAGSQQVSPIISSGNSGVGSKLICSPVSCIAEVQNGIEKKITGMIEYAAVAKRNRRPTFECDDVPAGFIPDGATEPTHYYYPVPPSLYAVGFDNGQLLLVCVTGEGGWMLRHFSSQYFGLRPIHTIAVRVPPFYTRLWTGCLPTITPNTAASASHGASTTRPKMPVTTLITSEQALIVHEEDQHIAAIACNGGVIALVRLPGMEIISSVAPTDYNAVGEIVALQWTSTSPRRLLAPDVLVASGEDDTMTAFQLLAQHLASATGSSHPLNITNNGTAGVETASHLSSSESVLASGRLRILEKKKFHRSWVTRLNLFPVVLPATPFLPSSAASEKASGAAAGANTGGQPRKTSSAQVSACATGGGMPQYVGVCLVGTSYDHRTSFWPYIFSNSGDGVLSDTAESEDLHHSIVSGNEEGGQHLPSTATTPDHYVLVDGPTAAYPLHSELVIGVAAAGGGTSFFLVTVCCRGKVQFWSMHVKV